MFSVHRRTKLLKDMSWDRKGEKERRNGRKEYNKKWEKEWGKKISTRRENEERRIEKLKRGGRNTNKNGKRREDKKD